MRGMSAQFNERSKASAALFKSSIKPQLTNRQQGVALIEAAIVVPIIVLIAAWSIELCLYLLCKRDVINATRAGLELAAATPNLGVNDVNVKKKVDEFLPSFTSVKVIQRVVPPNPPGPVTSDLPTGKTCAEQVTLSVSVIYKPIFLRILGISEWEADAKLGMRYLHQPLCY